MADGEDIQPLVCDNGTGMVKVSRWTLLDVHLFCSIILFPLLIYCSDYFIVTLDLASVISFQATMGI